MKTISAREFKQAVTLDPAWASKLTEPVAVSEFVSVRRTNITHLSPLLHFMGQTPGGIAADFAGCKELEAAEGVFYGKAMFEESGIKEIKNLTFRDLKPESDAANFNQCRNLKIARGTFPGFVDFTECGIERIADITVTKCDKNGQAANFYHCPNLKTAAGTYHGVVQFGDAVERIGKITIIPNERPAETPEREEDPKPKRNWRESQAIFQFCAITHCLPEHLSNTALKIPDENRPSLANMLEKEAAARRAMKQPNIEL